MLSTGRARDVLRAEGQGRLLRGTRAKRNLWLSFWRGSDPARRSRRVTTPVPSLARRALAEGIGTFALVFAGCGAIVTDSERHGALGVVGVGLVFFLVLLAAIAALGHVSGAHFNPGVSLSFLLTRHLPGRDLAAYVIAQLIAHHLNGDLVEAVATVLGLLKGTYGLAVVCPLFPGVVVGARLGSPLVLGLGDGENYLASDSSAFVGRTDRVVYLQDRQLCVVEADWEWECADDTGHADDRAAERREHGYW